MESTTPSGLSLILVDKIEFESGTIDSRSSSPKDVIFTSRSFSTGSDDMVDDFKFLFEKIVLSSEQSNESLSLPFSAVSQNEKEAKNFKRNYISSNKSSSLFLSKSDPTLKTTSQAEIQFVAASLSNPELSFSQHAIEDVKNESKKNIVEAAHTRSGEKKKRSSFSRALSKKCTSKIFSQSPEEVEIKENLGISPLQKRVTCEELIIKGFDYIDEPLVTNMISLERARLSIALKNTITKIENILSAGQRTDQSTDQKLMQKFKHSLLESDYTRNCSSLSLVKAVQKKLQDKQLMKLIEENVSNFWDSLSVSGATILPSGQLFSLIFAYIQQLEQNEDTLDKVMSMLMFCSHWLIENQGNKLVNETKNQIEEIVQLASNHQKDVIQIEGKKILENLTIALSDRKINCNQMNFDLANCVDFNSALKDICTKKIDSSKYTKMVEITAEDLCNSQVAYYNQITAQDFFQENWATPTMLYQLGNHCNLLNAYVNQMIFYEKSFGESVLLMKFFLDVGYKCLQLNDFSSACAIGGIFFNSSFKNKPDIWTKVTSSDKFYQKMYKKLKKIFYGNSTDLLRFNLENCYKNDKFFIPHIGIYMHDVELCKGHPAIIESDSEDPQFNIIKVNKIHETIITSLRGQIKWKNSDYENYKYKTNLLSNILPSFQPLDEL